MQSNKTEGCTSENGNIHFEGRTIDYTLWRSPKSSKAVLIAPAMGVSRRFYGKIAQYFAQLGYSTITFDYYGMVGKNNYDDYGPVRLKDWGIKDIDTIIGFALKEFSGQEYFFLGHSIAGQLFPLAARSNKISRAFFVASQNVSQQNWEGLSKLKVGLFWNLIVPLCCGLFGYVPALAYGGKYSLDQFIAKDWANWGKSQNGILSKVPQALSKYTAIDVPTKFLSFSDDRMLAPLKSVEHLFESYGSSCKEHEHINPKRLDKASIGHFNFFKQEYAFLWPKIDAWFIKKQQN
ncbi:alpha/beta hydrolase [Flagellimonas nanhaiensis]|uniref:Uncharacterized protein n=1 Tax=Flagellimonas nanhaiensis TaxID=2292706 RepID=A0A371JSH0_9FLAO|nr:alpha/beta hydrolase [Allomuricauda nanhaiensis]RDY60760.1 hypothetical protein DX873_00840 [Allomuricauda nanhaiensis]